MNYGQKEKRINANYVDNGAILSLDGIRSGYGKKEILHSISLVLRKGSITALIGPNGSGKSTVLKTIFGFIQPFAGTLIFEGKTYFGTKPYDQIKSGMAYVPQGNHVFHDLTVKQNIEVSLIKGKSYNIVQVMAEIAALFPILKERSRQKAGQLSGGEKQQLALAMALVKKPKVLLLDEPSLGLAPNLRGNVFTMLKDINSNIGVSILIVEQKVHEVLQICHNVYSLKLGMISFDGSPSELKNNREKLSELFL